MPLYEHVFLARPDVSNQQVEELTESYKSIIAGNGGNVAKAEYWGLKSISFRINKNRKAHYTLLNIDAPPAAVAEMERQMRLSEDVLRFLTLRVDELEEGPSAMMRRDSRDDRRGGRGGRDGGGRDRDRDGGGRDRDRDRPSRPPRGGSDDAPRAGASQASEG